MIQISVENNRDYCSLLLHISISFCHRNREKIIILIFIRRNTEHEDERDI